MSLSVVAGLLWIVAANLLAMLPSRDDHWRRAYALIAVGLPLAGWILWSAGPWWALAFLGAGASVLRWPVRFALRWLGRIVAR